MLVASREIIPREAREGSAKVRVNVELQDDFSMDQALSLYLLETIPLMDPQAPDYALVLLTLDGNQVQAVAVA